MNKIIAHVRSTDKKEQLLEQHLTEVSLITGKLASKINMRNVGELMGLMHDFGKYSQQFQNYIQSATGILNPDLDDDWIDATKFKGKIDHSSAGAQWIWNKLKKFGGEGKLYGQILALCIASHHSGLIDCLTPDGNDSFLNRMLKEDSLTNLKECIKKADLNILDKANKLVDKSILITMNTQIKKICEDQIVQRLFPAIQPFYLGFWVRFLFSCLIDGDRINSADFENPHYRSVRNDEKPCWDTPISRLEIYLRSLKPKNTVDIIRREISDYCLTKALFSQGIYSLSVPTGGGKTYASLRFALHHAKKHKLDRIIYVAPYTSIIDQNAQAIRSVIEHNDDHRQWILEHHSNLEPEKLTWRNKLISENWDAPIILITMVQLLETFFGGGTRGVRRLHQLANSVIIFDEIQTLPVKYTHLFCNAVNFLTTHTKTSVVLCTATQPLLDKLKIPGNGQLHIPVENEIVKNKTSLFAKLKRVNLYNKIKLGGWKINEITQLILDEYKKNNSCLVIANTKAWTRKIFEYCYNHVPKDSIFHLSTNQCPAHRKKILQQVKSRLKLKLPVLCISTQLIEAGVDVDFSCVIRFLAGLDSIAQAAGRCNRNGILSEGKVYIINPDEENIDLLPDIKLGKEITERILSEYNDNDFLSPIQMERYFEYYFYKRASEMSYRLPKNHIREDTLLNLLSYNEFNPGNQNHIYMLRQSFMSAGKIFEAIDAPTESVIVPFEGGKEIITELCAVAKEFNADRYYKLLMHTQKYSVNIFPHVYKKLFEKKAIQEIQQDGIHYLNERFYDENYGLSTELIGKSDVMIC